MVAHVPALKTPRLQVLLLLHPHRHQALLHQLHHLPILFMETIAGLAGGMLNLLVELSVLMEIQLSVAMANIVLLIFLVLILRHPLLLQVHHLHHQLHRQMIVSVVTV